jgi:signal transduction histidine kinase
VRLGIRCRENLTVRADPSQLQQVVMNLVVNARDAMPQGGRIDIEAGSTAAETAAASPPLPAGRYAFIKVSDTGTGLTPEVRSRLFEPFFTTKPRGQGTGLGLSTVYAIVTGAGGGIAVDSVPGQGSTFCVYLPQV